MSLVIAVLMIIGILVICGSEKAGERDYDSKESVWKKHGNWFEKTYTSPELEKEIKTAIGDKSMRAGICREVNAALQEMPSWNDIYCDEEKNLNDFRSEELMYSSRSGKYISFLDYEKPELHILLANRGKVSCFASTFGYKSCLDNSRDEASRQYELVEWIQKTLKKHGVELKPIHKEYFPHDKVYGWIGSFCAPQPQFVNDVRKAFDRSLLEPQPPKYTTFKLDE